MRDLGWDDYFVVFAACLNTTASALVLTCEFLQSPIDHRFHLMTTAVDYGLGRHYVHIGIDNMVKYQSVCSSHKPLAQG